MRDCDGNSAEVSVLVMGDKRIKPLKMGNVRPLLRDWGTLLVILRKGWGWFGDLKLRIFHH